MLEGYFIFYYECFKKRFLQNLFWSAHSIHSQRSNLPSLYCRVWRVGGKGIICWTWQSKANNSGIFKINNFKISWPKAIVSLRREPQPQWIVVRISVGCWDGQVSILSSPSATRVSHVEVKAVFTSPCSNFVLSPIIYQPF